MGNSGIALTVGGNVWTWGYDSYGELGNGTTTGLNPNPTPGQVPNLSGIVMVSGGPHHAAALASDGTVWTWGRNGSGDLGNNTTTDSSVPVHVLGSGGIGLLTGVSTVVAGGGDAITVALKSDGTVWTWGDNSSGQLGTGTVGGNSMTPVQAVGPGGSGFLTGIVAIAAGGSAVSAVRGSDGSVWAWGWNYYGQLGIGSTSPTFTATPSEVVGPGGIGFLTGVKRVVGGNADFLAVDSGGNVWGWGQDINGQLGDGNTTTSQTSPVQTKGVGGTGVLSSISDISGSQHSLADLSEGTAMYAWGYNHDGELGNNTTSGYSANPLLSRVVGPNDSGYLGGIAQPICN
jgi:alpha-tubulin suppressor-like RCC1 family protein